MSRGFYKQDIGGANGNEKDIYIFLDGEDTGLLNAFMGFPEDWSKGGNKFLERFDKNVEGNWSNVDKERCSEFFGVSGKCLRDSSSITAYPKGSGYKSVEQKIKLNSLSDFINVIKMEWYG